MPSDAITLLQNVKQAEEEKVRAIAGAKREAETLLRSLHKSATSVDAEARKRVAAEEPRLRAEVEAKVKADLEVLEVWHKRKLDTLRDAARRNLDSAVEAARGWFTGEWKP